MNPYDETRIAELLRSLPNPPEAWMHAAKELPQARRELDEIVLRAEADAAFRRALIADLEAALVESGYDLRQGLVEQLRDRLRSG